MPTRGKHELRIYCKNCQNFRRYMTDAAGGHHCTRCAHFCAGYRPIRWHTNYAEGGGGKVENTDVD